MIIGNELIKLQKLDDYHFLIVADHEVGKVGINADNELEVFINKDDQGRHYASNAVYLFDKYLHETLKIDIINAKVKKENDIYRHVVEHCGYHKQKEDDVCFYYIHQVAKTIKDDCQVNDEHHNAIYLCGLLYKIYESFVCGTLVWVTLRGYYAEGISPVRCKDVSVVEGAVGYGTCR